MNIEEAKNELEKQIILWDGVNGIGVINKDNIPVIEVAIDKNHPIVSEKIKGLIKKNQWKGYNVIIVATDGFNIH
ncbi:MAG: hypothetical protein JNJ41_01985 [Bacteroidia bacterium]|nr:hypothetical protein [Bacteroidia bacterium]